MTLAEQLRAVVGRAQVCENEPMKNHTTFRIGGPADVFVSPETEESLICGLKWCREQNIPFYVIGNGSNLLVGDKGFRGVIFRVCKNLEDVEVRKRQKRFMSVPEPESCWQSWQSVFLPEVMPDLSLPQVYPELLAAP